MMPLQFSPSASFIHRLRRIAPRLLRRLPRPRWAIRRYTHCTTADGQPLMSTSSGLRLTARRGRLTLKPQADFRDSLSVDCVNRHPSALFTPSRQRSFGCLTSVSRNIVITAHRHIQPLDLIGVSASRESGDVVCVEIRERNFHAHGSDFTAHRRGWLCIFRGGERGERKNDVQRGGGCAKPLRGQAPVTPNSLILRSLHLATRYKSKIFVERDPCEMPNLPESQIFKA